MISFRTVTLLCAVTLACGTPVQEVRTSRDVVQTEDDLLNSVHADCLERDSISCLKYKFFALVDKLEEKSSITVADGVQLVKTGDDKSDRAARFLDGDGDADVDTVYFNKLMRFVEGHSVTVDLKGSDLINAAKSTARSFSDALEDDAENEVEEEGRGKKKKIRRVLGPLMALAGIKMAILGKLALAVIALIATKALIIGKIALVLSAVLGFKKLFGSGNNNNHVTHEIVAHPQHSSSHVVSHDGVYGSSGTGYSSADIGGIASSHHGGWQRSLEGQQLAYRGHEQAKSL